MKYLVVALLSLFCFSISTSADELVCTLESGDRIEVAFFNLNDPLHLEAGVFTDRNVYDLGFYLTAVCDESSCHLTMEINSDLIEGEFEQVEFDIDRNSEEYEEVFRYDFTNPKDERDYEIYCEYPF